jgi:hypothetical protein
MMDRLVALILDEGRWFPISMGLALLSISILLYRLRNSNLAARRRITAAMNLFFGVTIGTMAFGHLLAVTTKLALGTLRGSVLFFYVIGIVLAVPSAWLIRHARELVASDDDLGNKTIGLNVWLGMTLLVLGPPNLPLAAPALFNIAYQRHSRRAIGWAIVSAAVVLNVGLFLAALVFLASGQTFEQFSGVE